jgi:hypothetical protein
LLRFFNSDPELTWLNTVSCEEGILSQYYFYFHSDYQNDIYPDIIKNIK